MGMTTIIFVSAISAFEIMVILNSMGSHWIKAVLGYKVWIDIVYGVGFTAWSVIQGSVSAFVIASISGFIMTGVLTFFAGYIGYRRKERQTDGSKAWVEYAPTITINSIVNKAKTLFATVKVKGAEVCSAF